MANVVVQLQDANGNNIASNNVPITLTLNTGSFAAGSTTTVNSDATGKATFSNLKINTAGTYTITAAASGIGAGLTSATSSSFNIIPAAASTLSVSGYPSPREAGQPGTLTVIAKDQYGNTATNYTGTVHLTSSDSQAALAANHTYTASDAGSYQFTGSTFGTGGTQSLTATDINTPSITGTQSGIIIFSTVANKLAFTTQPVNTTNGATMANVVVQIQDQFGNNVSSIGVNVSLALVGGGTLGGTTNQTTDANGTATFGDLNVLGAGTGYTLNASATGLAGASSSSFNVAKASTANAVSVSANPTPTGSNVTLSAALTPIAPGAGTPTGSVQFVVDGTAFGSPATLSSGTASLTTAALSHGSHTVSAQYAGDGNFFGSTNSLSPNLMVNKAPAAGMHYLSTVLNTTLNVSATTLAGLDYDADGDTLSITAVSATSTNGAAVSLASGTITYVPVSNFVGTDQFTYGISDGYGGTNICKAIVTVRLGKATAVFNSITSPSSGVIILRGYGVPGNQYDVQESSDPTFSTYTVLSTATALPSGVIIYTDNNANTSPRYYRFAVH